MVFGEGGSADAPDSFRDVGRMACDTKGGTEACGVSDIVFDVCGEAEGSGFDEDVVHDGACFIVPPGHVLAASVYRVQEGYEDPGCGFDGEVHGTDGSGDVGAMVSGNDG